MLIATGKGCADGVHVSVSAHRQATPADTQRSDRALYHNGVATAIQP